MWMLPLVTVHQGMALGAAGVILCAVSDVRPAITAVQSRFENLSKPQKQTNPRSIESITQSVTERKASKERKLKSIASPEFTPTSTEAWFFNAANFGKTAPGFDNRSSGPVLSIKSTRRAGESEGLDLGSNEGESDNESWTTSDEGSYTTDSDTNSHGDNLSRKLTTSKSMKKKMEVVALCARRHAPAWHVDSNPVANVFGLLVGLMSLMFIAMASSFPKTYNQGYKGNTRNGRAILHGDDFVEEGDEML